MTVRLLRLEPTPRRKIGRDGQAWRTYRQERRRAAAALLVQAARQLELIPHADDVRLARQLLRKAARIHPRPAQ